MSDQHVLMARQPIFDKNVNIVAYELLFRNFDQNEARVIDGDNATSEVLVNAFTTLDINEVISNKLAYINFTKHLIENPPPFDKKKFVIEVLEDVEIDDALVKSLEKLSKEKFTIALDDFVYNDQSHRILPFADIVKIDVLLLTKEQLIDHVRRLRQYKIKLLAEKVETHEMYEHCKTLGFELFQGYFLCKPELVMGKKIPAGKLLVLQLVAKLQNPDISIEELVSLIGLDPVLSFKTLKLVNAACYAPSQKIESLTRAITYIGLNAIRSLVSLLAMSNLDDKPSALKDHSVIRAKMCELLGAKISRPDAGIYFSVGLLSTLDAFFDKPIEELLLTMSLHDDVVAALLSYEGIYGAILQTVLHLEKAEFDQINWPLLANHQIDPMTLNEIQRESISWYQASGL